MKIINKKSEKSLINHFVANFKKDFYRKKKQNKKLSFVLTGGESPRKLYRKLARINIDWNNVDLFWGDERYVSQKSKNSNYKQAFETLIKKINISKKNLFPINTKMKNALNSSTSYSNIIKNYFKNKTISFDCFLLGMGIDGHIASIFPNSDELLKKFIAKPVNRKDFIRITLSLNIINNSKKTIVWLNNKFKSKIFNELKKKGKKIPINNLNKKKTFIYKIK